MKAFLGETKLICMKDLKASLSVCLTIPFKMKPCSFNCTFTSFTVVFIQSTCLSFDLSIYLLSFCLYLFIFYLSMSLSIYRSIYLFNIHLSICLSKYIWSCLSKIYRSVCLPACLRVNPSNNLPSGLLLRFPGFIFFVRPSS